MHFRETLSRTTKMLIFSGFFAFLALPLAADAKGVSKEVLSQRPHKLGGNCVKYARTVNSGLHMGLTSRQAKVNKINSSTPEKGSIAVTDESGVGHVAVVKDYGDGFVIVEDANVIPGQVTVRRLAYEDVIGYIVFANQEA